MPDLDVTDVLTDPDFIDRTLLLHRVIQAIGEDGRLDEQIQPAVPMTGVVTTDNARRLAIQPDGTRIQSAIRINTSTPVYVTSPSNEGDRRIADRIEWRGYVYRIDSIDDYGTYGVGLYVAHCSVLEVS